MCLTASYLLFLRFPTPHFQWSTDLYLVSLLDYFVVVVAMNTRLHK